MFLAAWLDFLVLLSEDFAVLCLQNPAHSYYPTVGLHSSGEEVRLNFGSGFVSLYV